MNALKTRQDPCDLDFLALGALVHRLDPGIVPFRKARAFDVHVSGGEYNVAANLADCFRLKAAVATAMVDYPIGEMIQTRVREMGVRPFYKLFEHDGMRGPNMATVYSDRGFGVREAVLFYNRANEAAAFLKPGDFDWKSIASAGLRWFHSGGIFAALSDTTSELILDGMNAAHAAGAVTSFDLNYRPKLWASIGGPQRAQQVLERIVGSVDVLFGNAEAFDKCLGISSAAAAPGINTEAAFTAIDRVVRQYPNLKLIATTLRAVHSTNRHDWAAVLRLDGQRFISPTAQLEIYDRVGGGDGFAAGLIYGFLTARPPEESLRLGVAHGALLTTTPGDTTMVTLPEVEALARKT